MKTLGLLILTASVLFPAVQLFTLPNINDQLALFSQYLGLAALILMSWGQIMSTRMVGIETLFGGMDRVYILHKWAGIVALAAAYLHEMLDAEIEGLGPENPLNDLAESLGEISLYGIMILIAITIATFVPYHLWKWTHKFIGALFIVGAVHFFLMQKPFAMSDPAGLYTGAFCVAGALAYIWMLLPARLGPSSTYRIVELQKTGGAIAVTLEPEGRGLRPRPGQFGVLRFEGSGKAEPHPFSFSKIGDDGALRVTMKGLGDFTKALPQHLAVGQKISVQGPYGRFLLRKKGSQIWIAGGIGITPFLAWADALGDSVQSVDLFYCVRGDDQAPHLDELQEIASAKSNLNLHIVNSADGQRISAELISNVVGSNISSANFAFCGPVGLRSALQSSLKPFGVSRRKFHFEEFEFRTGIGILGLFRFIVQKFSRQN